MRRFGLGHPTGLIGSLIWSFIVVFAAGCGGGGNGGGAGGGVVIDPPDPVVPPAGSVTPQRVFPLVSLVDPVLMLQPPGADNLWFFIEQRGVVSVLDTNGMSGTNAPFLNIESIVDSAASEAGLLGMAFHPDFATNGYFYVSYTATGSPLRNVISRFSVDSGTGLGDPNSEQVLLEIDQPAVNHNGGHIAFDYDNAVETNLYVAIGDGGGAGDQFGNGQNTRTLLGAILRLNVGDGTSGTYTIPNTNPFRGQTECAGGSGVADCPEIFAWGLRNPWRFSFDRSAGDLWAGDVGQGSWEEINRVTGGQNYGWNEREGANCFPPGNTTCDTNNVDPITEYAHGLGFSVTGGYVYRGSDYPGLDGQYIFGDFVTGRIWRVPADSPQGTAPVELAVTTLSIASFAEGNDGELYVVDYGEPSRSAGVYRLVAN